MHILKGNLQALIDSLNEYNGHGIARLIFLIPLAKPPQVVKDAYVETAAHVGALFITWQLYESGTYGALFARMLALKIITSKGLAKGVKKTRQHLQRHGILKQTSLSTVTLSSDRRLLVDVGATLIAGFGTPNPTLMRLTRNIPTYQKHITNIEQLLEKGFDTTK